MNKKAFIISLLCLLALPGCAQTAMQYVPEPSRYGSGWWEPDTLGNHRVVVAVDKAADVVEAWIPWRRRDHQPEKKGLVVVNASTGRIIDNVLPIEINQEYGLLRFDASTGAGNYYVYYLPYHTSGGPYPKVSYPKRPDQSQPAWRERCRKLSSSKVAQAHLVRFESLGSFNSFYPMEIIATAAEKQALLNANPGKTFLLLPEDREHPIRMFDNLSYRQVERGATGEFFGEGDQGEYYVLQLGLWACRGDVNSVKVSFDGLKGPESGRIEPKDMTCFNTEGVDWLGHKVSYPVHVSSGRVQPLWIGIQMPRDVKRGLYTGTVTVSDAAGHAEHVKVMINLSDNVLADGGDSEPWRLSRLRWLNSTLQENDKLVKPFTPMTVNGHTVGVLGRTLTVGELGLPTAIQSYFTEEMTSVGKTAKDILAKPMTLEIKVGGSTLPIQVTRPVSLRRIDDGAVEWTAAGKAGDISVDVNARMEFDGVAEFHMNVSSTRDVHVDDISLLTPMTAAASKYRLGMGYEGSLRPKSDQWKWNIKRNQEGFWFGDVNAGMQCLFRDVNYRRPLNTNFYQLQPLNLPTSWWNNGQGGINYSQSGETLDITTYSGARTIARGDTLHFNFMALITPFKPIDTQKQWGDRYYHGYHPVEKDKSDDSFGLQAADIVAGTGANTINIHHATPINPFINYPFLRPQAMKNYVDYAHSAGDKVKIYYTVRELTNHAPEFFALKSLGHEIFSPGKGGGFAWLQEHLDGDYIGAWFVDYYKDAAIVNTGISRWHNFYVEGLNWLTRNIGIDGVYIDDLAFDRNTMKRIRRTLEQNRPEPRIDVHSANQFNPSDGYINSMFLYMEHMPYLDRLWFGEYFKYDKGPDYWLTDVSGIPFGMMSEMLQDGGNPWRGMLYGMTAREPSNKMPARLWKVWDSFGIKQSRMIGYWVTYNPVKTGRDDILATTFVRDGKTMIAIASWAKEDADVKLKIDYKKLGINPKKAMLTAPAIEDFQQAFTAKPDDTLKVPAGKGFLLILE